MQTSLNIGSQFSLSFTNSSESLGITFTITVCFCFETSMVAKLIIVNSISALSSGAAIATNSNFWITGATIRAYVEGDIVVSNRAIPFDSPVKLHPKPEEPSIDCSSTVNFFPCNTTISFAIKDLHFIVKTVFLPPRSTYFFRISTQKKCIKAKATDAQKS